MTVAEDPSARARAWRDALHAAVCDVIEPWEHGTIVRATRYPSYYDFNLVRVEDDEPIAAATVVALADSALAGLGHRRLNFDFLANAQPLRAELEAAGWTTMRLLWLRQDAPPPQPSPEVSEVPYDDVGHLRIAWHHEHSPGSDPTAYHRHAREVALSRAAVLMAVEVDGSAVGYSQLERDGDGAEVTQVYVLPEHRGRGVGTALTRAAMSAAQGVRDLWICADDEDRPKRLYARLGFAPVWTTMEFERVP